MHTSLSRLNTLTAFATTVIFTTIIAIAATSFVMGGRHERVELEVREVKVWKEGAGMSWEFNGGNHGELLGRGGG